MITLIGDILALFRMNKNLVLASCLIWRVSSMAQEMRPRHEITTGWGYGTLLMVKDFYHSVSNKWPFPSVHLQYMYNINRKAGLGLTLDYTYNGSDTYKEVVPKYDMKGRFIGGDLIETKNRINWITICPTARFYWFDKGYFAMYSRFGAGIVIASDYVNRTYFMPNISPVALEWGGRHLRFCTEICSIGSLGLLNGSMKWSF